MPTIGIKTKLLQILSISEDRPLLSEPNIRTHLSGKTIFLKSSALSFQQAPIKSKQLQILSISEDRPLLSEPNIRTHLSGKTIFLKSSALSFQQAPIKSKPCFFFSSVNLSKFSIFSKFIHLLVLELDFLPNSFRLGNLL